MEAIGAFVMCQNNLEISLHGLILHIVGDEAIASYLHGHLNNRQKVDLILLASENFPQPAKGLIKHAMTCYDICTENRNLIVHALSDNVWKPPDGELVMVKLSKDPSPIAAEYLFPLHALRGAAISAQVCCDFIYAVDLAMMEDDEPPTWPEKPPQPGKLSLFRRAEVPDSEFDQPLS